MFYLQQATAHNTLEVRTTFEIRNLPRALSSDLYKNEGPGLEV